MCFEICGCAILIAWRSAHVWEVTVYFGPGAPKRTKCALERTRGAGWGSVRPSGTDRRSSTG